MTPSEHFMRHATECRSMADIAMDRESKAAWVGMAERWRRCAELARQQDTVRATQPRRKPAKSHGDSSH